MVNNKVLLLSILNLIFISGCANHTPRNTIEDLKIQIKVIPAVINSDESLFIESMKVMPNSITKRAYDGAVKKGLYLQLSEHEISDKYELESDTHVNEINSLCIMGKFLLNPTYMQPEKPYTHVENYQNFFEWLKIKQSKWEKILNDTPVKFEHPCLAIAP